MKDMQRNWDRPEELSETPFALERRGPDTWLLTFELDGQGQNLVRVRLSEHRVRTLMGCLKAVLL